MNRVLILAALAVALLVVPACAPSPAKGPSGSLPMMPFVDENYGIRGNAPLEGWSDQALLIQESFTGTVDDLVAYLVEKTDLVRLPRSAGTYEGAYLAWELYSFTTQLAEAGPGIYQVELALAEMENGRGYYLVILVARSSTYEANRAQYRAVLEHALYALAPL